MLLLLLLLCVCVFGHWCVCCVSSFVPKYLKCLRNFRFYIPCKLSKCVRLQNCQPHSSTKSTHSVSVALTNQPMSKKCCEYFGPEGVGFRTNQCTKILQDLPNVHDLFSCCFAATNSEPYVVFSPVTCFLE